LVRTDVNTVLETVVGSVLKDPAYARDASHAIAIKKNYDLRLPAVMADPMQLQQIFMNLLLNAADAMLAGGTLVLETTLDRGLGMLQIKISDTGTGIDAAVINNIFKPFFTTKAKGTGLGLAITKRLVEENEGQIRFESRANGGTAFIITLPALQEGESQA
jgi:signal transduction histidine kinase